MRRCCSGGAHGGRASDRMGIACSRFDRVPAAASNNCSGVEQF